MISGCLFILIAGCQKTKEQKAAEYQEKPEISFETRLPHLLDYEVNPDGFPRSLKPDGSVRKVRAKDWTSGFYPGSLLYLYRLTEDEAYFQAAQKWLPFSAREQTNDGTHDMGFKTDKQKESRPKISLLEKQ